MVDGVAATHAYRPAISARTDRLICPKASIASGSLCT
jgi:hypothetical protein